MMEHLSRCRNSIGGPSVGAFSFFLKDNEAGEETSALVFA
jgi:hypothetical protein